MSLDGDALRKERDRVRGIWDRQAPKYDKGIRLFERLLFAGGRAWACSQTKGEVLELGIGTGRNLPFYPEDVRLTGIDISPAMLAVARRRADKLGRAVDLREGDAQDLPFGDESFDSVVSTLALCSIPDSRRAVAEAKRVLRRGGRFQLLEHVRSPHLPVRLAQHILDPIAVRLEGDHLLRDPVADLRDEGFEIDVVERSKLGLVERVTARRPGEERICRRRT